MITGIKQLAALHAGVLQSEKPVTVDTNNRRACDALRYQFESEIRNVAKQDYPSGTLLRERNTSNDFRVITNYHNGLIYDFTKTRKSPLVGHVTKDGLRDSTPSQLILNNQALSDEEKSDIPEHRMIKLAQQFLAMKLRMTYFTVMGASFTSTKVRKLALKKAESLLEQQDSSYAWNVADEDLVIAAKHLIDV